MRSNAAISVVALCLAACLGTSASRAAVITLTGGDFNDGWEAPNNVLLAYNVGDAVSDQLIQGVTFKAWNQASTSAPTPPAGITVSTNRTSGSNYTTNPPVYPSPTTNDNNMRAMMERIFYNNDSAGVGPLTFTISGLANVPYRFDAFTYSDNASPRANETFTFNDGTTDVFNEVQNSYLVTNIVTPVGGQIVLSITSPGGGTPILSGFALTAPEPSGACVALLAIAGGCLRRGARSLKMA